MIRTFNMDCIDLLKETPDKFYDLANVDVPYGIGMSGGNIGGSVLAKTKKYEHFSGNDNIAPNKDYFEHLVRVSKNQIIWGANHFIENIPNANSSSWIVWNKQNGDNNFADCELAWTSFKSAVRMFDFRWAGMLQGDMKNKQIRIHPTEKPYHLYKYCLQNYAKKGDKILDTHGGSFSHAIACHDYGFDLDICELHTGYYEKGVSRLKQHQSQTKLF